MPSRPSRKRPLAGSARAAHGAAIIVAQSVLLGHVQRHFSTPVRNFVSGARSRNSFLFFRECFGCLGSCLDRMSFSGAWRNERPSHGHRGSAEGRRARAGPCVPDATCCPRCICTEMPSAEGLGVQTSCCALRDSLEQRAELSGLQSISRTRQRVPMNLDHLRSDQVSSDQFRSET